MSVDPIRFTLKPEDMPDDPQTLMVSLLEALEDATRDAMEVRDGLTKDRPRGRLIARSVETYEGVARARDIAEQLAPACRRQRVFSREWSE